MEEESVQIVDRYGVGNKVYARWVDSIGVYFYAAEIIQAVNDDEVKVRFMEDGIEKVMKKDSEIISNNQLQPGDKVTVKHSVYHAYEVTASLISYPSRKGKDILYELSIIATDSEPSPNEDTRTVSHHEISLTDSQACSVLRKLGLVPSSNKVSASIDFENLTFGKRRSRLGNTPTRNESGPHSKTPRRKRGGEHVEDSATTSKEASAPDLSPTKKNEINRHVKETPGKTPKRMPKPSKSNSTPRRQAKNSRVLSTDDEEEILPRSRRMQGNGKLESSSKPPTLLKSRPSRNDLIFQGFCFILTQSKSGPKHMTDDETYSDSEPALKSSRETKFDKNKLRTTVSDLGGKVLSEFPIEGIEDASEELITVSDHRCITMTYLLSLSHQVPVLSHVYILDCAAAGELLDRTAYLLPAGFSTLLMREVEQRQDCRQELRINDCLLPSPPSTGGRRRGE